MSIDPRLVERRKAVAEGRANKSLRRLLKLLAVLTVLSAGVWVALSPWFSVTQVRSSGVGASDAHTTMVEHGVVAGTPMILLRPGQVELDLEEDPWISQARVHLKWPNEVVVRVIERVPAAWVLDSNGWTRRAVDGVALPSAASPNDELPSIEVITVPRGEAADSRFVLGALEFVTALASSHPDITVRLIGEELWAVVDGYDVRLGRPEEMEPKARSLQALLEEHIPEGSVLILIAPTHPAISLPPEAPDQDVGQPDGESD